MNYKMVHVVKNNTTGSRTDINLPNSKSKPLSLSNSSPQLATTERHRILRELPGIESDITDKDVIEYAKQIGINPEKEHDLLWIARKGLLANLPVEWLPVEDDQSRIYYYNKDSEASSWEHPADSTYRSLAESERSKRGRLNQSGFSASSTSVSMSGLTSLANLHFVDDDELSFNNDFNEITNGKGNDGKDKEGESKSRRRLESSNGGSLHNRVTVNPVENELLEEEEEEADVESVDFELELEEAVEELSFTDDIDGTGDQDGYEEERSKKAADAAKAIVASNGEEEEEEEEPEHDDDGDQLTFDITDEEERERKPLSEIFVVRLSEPEKEGRGKDEATMSSVLRTVQSKEGQIDEPRKVAGKVADSGQKLTPESGQRDGNAANLTIIDTEWKSKQISVESANMSIGSTEGQERERRRREKGEKSASSSKAIVTTGLPFHSNDDQSNLGQNEEDPFAESNLSVREETTNNNVSVERKKSGRLVREAAKGKEGEEDDYDEKHEQDGDFYGRGKATETDRKSFSESLVGLAAQRKEETMKTEKERDINISNRISERLEYDNDEDADDDAKEEEDAHGAGKGKCKQHTDETELDNASRQSLYSESRFSNPVDRMVNRESRNIVAQSVNYSLNEVDVQTKFDAISEQLRTQMDQIRNEIRDQMSTESTKANRSIMSKIEGLQEQIQSLRDTVDSMDSRKEQELISLETRLLRTMSRTDDRGQVHVNKKTLDDLETKFSRSQSDLGESLQQSMKTLRDQVSKQFYERLREVQQETSLKFDDFKYENSVNWSTTKKELSALNSSNRLLVDRNDKFDNDLTKYLSELDKVKADQRACVLRTDSRFEEQRDTLVLELDKVRSTLKKELHAVRDSVNDRLHQCLEKCEMSSKESQSAVDRAGVQLNRLKIEQQALREMADTMVEKEKENDLKILKVKQDVAELKTGLLETGKEKPDTETVPGQPVGDRELEQRVTEMEESVKSICIALNGIENRISDQAESKGTVQPAVNDSVKKDTTKSTAISSVNRKFEVDSEPANGQSETNSQIGQSKSDGGQSSTSSSQLIGPGVVGAKLRVRNETTVKRYREGEGGGGRRKRGEGATGKRNDGQHGQGQHHLSHSHRRRGRRCCRSSCCFGLGCEIGHEIDFAGPTMGNYLPFAALESAVPRSHRVANDVYSHRLNRSTSADIRNSSASLLSLIKRTTKMLKAEAAQLESLGKYDFDSLTTGSILDIGLAALDTDDQAIKKLTLVRNDVREKLKNVSDVIKQNNIEVNK